MCPESGPIVVYTDGACRGNPGRGGWAWAVPDGAYASGADAQTTNQRMEITAALEALRSLLPDATDGVEVVSDSTYVVKCFTDGWWRGGKRRGWKKSQNNPVANPNLGGGAATRLKDLAEQAGRQPRPVGAAVGARTGVRGRR